jgi:hypothetical protein
MDVGIIPVSKLTPTVILINDKIVRSPMGNSRFILASYRQSQILFPIKKHDFNHVNGWKPVILKKRRHLTQQFPS